MTTKTGRVVAKKIYGHDNVENKNLIHEFAELIFMNGRKIYELSVKPLNSSLVVKRFYYEEKPDVEFFADGEWEITRTNFIFDDEYDLKTKAGFKQKIINYLVELETEIRVNEKSVFIDKAFLLEELENYFADHDFYRYDGYPQIEMKTFLDRRPFEIARDVANRCEFKLRYFPATYENKEAYLEATSGKWVVQTFGYGASKLYDKMM
ncbi:hypothetical protein HCJ47_14000 [Listeria sp. FSL L7-1558]|uniref:Uncharacterized protein n=2 Tax=Listeria immobilis TaxID=2713502 RepID=A0ABR6T019_9LIST|nr:MULTISPECIES: hypothetical protein [Listeria]MBC1484504.1 hypothetical protein [Listeria immobilis]MBC1511192.1 hypothetical protein [Listeria immobilis]MBC1839603.1 hypothetical protein [Listeria seeligeri]MBC6313704.1 hypothetical protein [Listeria immobilis]